jgi:flavin reductase (DIM6/NTAB) family NADH-FMN oxidoreductase RutF
VQPSQKILRAPYGPDASGFNTALEKILTRNLRMPVRKKFDFPVDAVRRFIEPGSIILISSRHKGETGIMTCGWHMMMEYDTIGCFVWDQNHSRELIRKSRECVINIPTADMAKTVADIGNTSSGEIDKFKEFKLTPVKAAKVKAPLIGECFANFECRLVDTSLVRKYSLFVFEVVKAHAPRSPRLPKMLHYTGDGIFLTSGRTLNLSRRFKPEILKG